MSSGDGSEYRRVLHEWAAQFIAADGKVTGVEISYDDGYDPTFSNHEASLDITIRWTSNTGAPRWTDLDGQDAQTLGEVLTSLFAIAERDDVVQHSTTRPSRGS